jgi:hypothetical protein
MARAMKRDTGAERMSIRLDNITSRGRFNESSFFYFRNEDGMDSLGRLRQIN